MIDDDNESTTASAAPSEGRRDLSKIKATLDRIRKSKRNLDRADSPSPASRMADDSVLSDAAAATKSELRRKELQRMRAQSRGEQSSDVTSSLHKSRSEREKRLSRNGIADLIGENGAEQNYDGDEPQENEENNELEEVIEQYVSITTVSQPYYVYPTTLLPRSRSLENAIQPLLYTAASHPSFPTLNCGQSSACCGIENTQRRNELDLITGDIEMGVNDRSAAGAVNAEMERLLQERVDENSSVNEAPPPKQESSTVNNNVHRQDGLYVNQLPIFADILMNAEDVDSLPIAKLVESNVGLARVTQRTLRELKGGLDNERLRRLWSTMLTSSADLAAPRTVRKVSGKSTSDVASSSGFDNASYHHLKPDYSTKAPARTPLSSIAELLSQLSVGPVLRIIDDPVIDLPCQPVVPDPSLSYGGQLGNWPDDASNIERMGHLVVGGEGKRGSTRSLLRVHVHCLAVLEHPYVNEEENIFARMREVYQQYSSLIQRDDLGYLCGRVGGLVEELTRLISLSDEITLDEEEKACVRVLYKDLVESLPCLCEVRWAICSLSTTLYASWRSLQETRRRQGFASTLASLTVRRVERQGEVIEEIEDEVEGRDSGEGRNRRSRGRAREDRGSGASTARSKVNKRPDGGSNTEQLHGWDRLRGMLGGVSDMLSKVQDLFLRDAEAAEDLRLQEIQDHLASSKDTSDRALSKSGRDLLKKRTSQKLSRSSIDTGPEGDLAPTPSPIPLGPDDEFNMYIAQSLPVAVDCVGELLKGPSGARGQDESSGRGGHSLLPDYVIRVSEDGQVTADTHLTAAELHRRRMLNEIRYKVVLNVNGRAVTHSDAFELKHPSLIADFKQNFELRLIHEPTDLSVDIYSVSIGAFSCLNRETFLARVALPFPGQTQGRDRGSKTLPRQAAAHTYAPKMGWFTYSSEHPVVIPSGSYQSQRSRGAVLCTVEYDVAVPDRSLHQSPLSTKKNSQWDGIGSEELGLLPLPPLGSDFTPLGDPRRGDFARERDFQALLPPPSALDLNDPRNEHLLYLKSRGPAVRDRDVFLLAGLDFAVPFGEEGVPYTNYVVLSQALRMRLLVLRDLRPHLFTEPIPLSEEQIKGSELYRSILAAQPRTFTPVPVSGPSLSSQFASSDDPDPEALASRHDANKTKMSAFLERVRNSHTALSRRHRRKKMMTASAVAETEYFVADEKESGDILPPRKRALKPKPKVRTALSMEVSRCDMLVQVVGARNVPLRVEIDEDQFTATGGMSPKKALRGSRVGLSIDRGSEADDMENGEADAAVEKEKGTNRPLIAGDRLDATKMREKKRARTFVEVRFQEGVCCTTGMEGGSPLWKQSLSLPFRAPQGDYTPDNLAQVRDEVVFTLFDEIIEDDGGRGGLMEGESSERVERRFIGSFSLPFSTLFKEGRIEGTFRIDTPVFNFGYDHIQQIVKRNVRDSNSRMFVAVEGEEDDADEVIPGLGSLLYRMMLSYVYSSESIAEADKIRRTKKSEEARENGVLIHHETQNEFDFFASGGSSTYLKLMVTLDPLLSTPPDIPEEISSATLMPEDRFLAAHARSWLGSLAAVGKHTKNRTYKLFGMNSSGLNTFLPRYLTAQRPPKGFENRRACVHLTSIVPFMQDSQAFIGELDLWCTTQQLLDIGAGDEEEHAVMLYNMLYHVALADTNTGTIVPNDVEDSSNTSDVPVEGALPVRGQGRGKKPPRAGKDVSLTAGYPSEVFIENETVFLALGNAIPEGKTVYVLLRDTRKKGASSARCGAEGYLIINPSTGHIFSAGDPSCPLKEILVLITPYNLWANIQPDARPGTTLYDVINVDHWRPFFGARLPPPLGGLQTIQSKIMYSETTAAYCLEVEKTALQSIKDSMRKWRSRRHRSTTTFHPDACSVISDLLPLLEDWKRTGNLPGANDEDRDRDRDRDRDNYGTRASRNKFRDRDRDGNRDGDRDNAPLYSLNHTQSEVGEAVVAFQRLVRDRMRNILRTRTLKGCPLNAPFTDIEALLSQMKMLCVHEAKHPDVQFVLAVRAFPAVNNILSLWVFLGQIETKTSGYY